MVIMQPGLHCHNLLHPPPSLPLARLYSLDALQISDQASLTARVADSWHIASSFVLLPRVSLLTVSPPFPFPVDGDQRQTQPTGRSDWPGREAPAPQSRRQDIGREGQPRHNKPARHGQEVSPPPLFLLLRRLLLPTFSEHSQARDRRAKRPLPLILQHPEAKRMRAARQPATAYPNFRARERERERDTKPTR